MSESELPHPSKIIPHRLPFLFLDRVSLCQDMEIYGHYRFSRDNPIFVGHFPEQAIVPGVLILEGGAQTLAYWALSQKPDHLVLLTGIDQAKWNTQVLPEEDIIYRVKVLKIKLGLVVANLKVYVNEKEVCQALIKGYLKSKSSPK